MVRGGRGVRSPSEDSTSSAGHKKRKVRDDDSDSEAEVQIIAENSAAAKKKAPAVKQTSLGMFLHSVEIPVRNRNQRQVTPESTTRRLTELVISPERPKPPRSAGRQGTLTAFVNSSKKPVEPRSAERGRPAVKKVRRDSDSSLDSIPPPKTGRKSKAKKQEEDDEDFDPDAVAVASDDDHMPDAVDEDEDDDAVIEDDFSDIAEEEAPKKGAKKGKKGADEAVATVPIDSKVFVKGSGLQSTDLPPISNIQQMFDDIIDRIPKFADVARTFKGRKLKVATMCSGTESPLLALSMISRSLKKVYGFGLEVDHLFSCEIEPFKQAYIERNFRPPILFRDITELGNEEATTAYGAKVAVPGGVDLLIAGTSCVDFSNLNNKKQALDGSGESAQTFHGMLRYVDKHRPPIVIIENVSSGPWQTMQVKFESIGYAAAFQRFDTKHYYIPHTRVRGYMIAVNKKGSSIPAKWMQLTKALARPASSTLDAFLLPSDDPRIHKGRLALLKLDYGNGPRQAVDWTRCESRHLKARVEEHLGNRRVLTAWQQQGACTMPDFAWSDWANKQVERVLDLMDISTLRAAKKGVDPAYKSQVWNLSQNVDRTTASSKPGICPCLTPSMIPYITNRGGPMIGLEALSMQGLPIDELLLTRENQDQLADLAGNAMSSTVVGSAAIAGLILGLEFFAKPEDDMDIDDDDVHIKNEITGEEKLNWKELNLTADDIVIDKLIDHAERSARLCGCEGRTDMTKHPLQKCEDCGFTSCKNCGVKPEHRYSLIPESELKKRHSPISFEEQVKGRIPMRMKLSGMTTAFLESARKGLTHKIDDKLWSKWISSVDECLKSEFRFQNLKRQETWSVFYDSPNGKLELLLDPKKPEWRLFAKAKDAEPSGAEIRKILAQPIARHAVKKDIMEPNWEFCLPMKVKVPVTITGVGNLVDSWEATLGLEEPEYAKKKVWDQIEISYDSEYRKYFDRDISGVYNWHSKCGNANSSLHRKVDKKNPLPLFFFLDPGTCSAGTDDYFVFADNNRRHVFGEERPIQARLDPSFRQFSKKEITTNAHIDGAWIEAPGVVLVHPEHDTGSFGMPKKDLELVASHESCSAAQAILVCKVSLDKQAEDVWPIDHTIEVDQIRERTVYSALAWLTEPVKMFKDLEAWQSVPLKEVSHCQRCAPTPPAIKWIKRSNRFQAIEDTEQASPYEQALKKRPSPIVTHIHMDDAKLATLKIGLNPVTLMHRALANLPPSILAGDISVDWRLITGYTAPPSIEFPAFTIPDNRKDPLHGQPPNFIINLREEQRRSLYWMVKQESDEAEPFIEEEVVEAVMPHLGWRAEGRAQRPVYTKGGVLADDVGYGKTAVTVALIDVNRNKPLKEDILPGLIPVKTTLIVVPSHLCKQWPSEIIKFTGNSFKIRTITNQAHLNALTIADIESTDILIVSATLFSSGAYLKYLSGFSATKPCPTTQPRQFIHWASDAYCRVRERSLQLQEDGGKAVLKTIQETRSRLAKELEEAQDAAESKRLKGAAYQEAQKKASASAKKAKAKKIEDGDFSSEEDIVIALKSKLDDVWSLGGAAVNKDWKQMKCPPLGMFNWNRLVIDEYTYDSGKVKTKTALEGIFATNKWILSGTPPIEDFNDVQSIASFLNLHLGIDDEGGIRFNGRKKLDMIRTDAEKFQAMNETRTPDWALRRHLHAQKFLNQFMRKNVPLIDEIPFKDYYTDIHLPPAERAVYLELEHHLQALDMVARRKGKKNTDSDRDKRLNSSLDKSNSGQEALVKRSSYFDLGKPDSKGLYYPRLACDKIVERRERQLEQCAYEIHRSLQEQERKLRALPPKAAKEEFFADYCTRAKNNGIGDADASEMMRELIAEAKKDPNKKKTPPEEPELTEEEREELAKEQARGGKKGGKSKKKADDDEDDFSDDDKKKPKKLSADEQLWEIRESTHGIKRLDKELVGRTRSLRYFKLVRDLQDQLAGDKGKNDTYTCPQCSKTLMPKDVALLSSCGHHGCYKCLVDGANTEKCVVLGCESPARHESITKATSLISSGASLNAPTKYRYGAKMGALIKLIKEEIPKEEKVLVFVQFPDLMERIRRALETEKVPVLDITGSANAKSNKLQTFQDGGANTRVLLLNVGDESASGANLTVANHAIFVAPLYTESAQEFFATETQAIGRVVRYGQKREVKIYRLFAHDTIDQRLWDTAHAEKKGDEKKIPGELLEL